VRWWQFSRGAVACLAGMVGIGGAAPDDAQAQQASSGLAQINRMADNNGEDFTRPENLFQLRYVYRLRPAAAPYPA
jgi:hypothetical protein